MILAKFKEFVKVNLGAILLAAIVMLLVLLSFAVGYIIAAYGQKPPIEIF